MRVLMLNQTFWPDLQATSHYLGLWSEYLAREGHDVTVLTSQRAYSDPAPRFPRREIIHGVKVERVWNTAFGYGPMWHRVLDYLSFLLAAGWRALFLSRPEVVVAMTTPPLLSVLGALLALFWRTHFVYWVMDLNPDEAIEVGWLAPDGWKTQLMERLSRWSLHRAAQVVVQDRYVKERLVAKGILAEKIQVIPLWSQAAAEFDPGKREEFRQLHNVTEKFVVMYAGNHTPCHPLQTLIDAAAFLRDEADIRFFFIGFGQEWSDLRDRAQMEKWKNTVFMGYQPLSTGVVAAADVQMVVMGDPFVGIIHPCKVYNFLVAERPFIYIGPERSHIADLIAEAGLEEIAGSFRHGQGRALADDIFARAHGKVLAPWPAKERFLSWSREIVLRDMTATLEKASTGPSSSGV